MQSYYYVDLPGLHFVCRLALAWWICLEIWNWNKMWRRAHLLVNLFSWFAWNQLLSGQISLPRMFRSLAAAHVAGLWMSKAGLRLQILTDFDIGLNHTHTNFREFLRCNLKHVHTLQNNNYDYHAKGSNAPSHVIFLTWSNGKEDANKMKTDMVQKVVVHAVITVYIWGWGVGEGAEG